MKRVSSLPLRLCYALLGHDGEPIAEAILRERPVNFCLRIVRVQDVTVPRAGRYMHVAVRIGIGRYCGMSIRLHVIYSRSDMSLPCRLNRPLCRLCAYLAPPCRAITQTPLYCPLLHDIPHPCL